MHWRTIERVIAIGIVGLFIFGIMPNTGLDIEQPTEMNVPTIADVQALVDQLTAAGEFQPVASERGGLPIYRMTVVDELKDTRYYIRLGSTSIAARFWPATWCYDTQRGDYIWFIPFFVSVAVRGLEDPSSTGTYDPEEDCYIYAEHSDLIMAPETDVEYFHIYLGSGISSGDDILIEYDRRIGYGRTGYNVIKDNDIPSSEYYDFEALAKGVVELALGALPYGFAVSAATAVANSVQQNFHAGSEVRYKSEYCGHPVDFVCEKFYGHTESHGRADRIYTVGNIKGHLIVTPGLCGGDVFFCTSDICYRQRVLLPDSLHHTPSLSTPDEDLPADKSGEPDAVRSEALWFQLGLPSNYDPNKYIIDENGNKIFYCDNFVSAHGHTRW